MCLHPIVQPVVSDAQAVIRWQRSMLDRAVAAMEYSLARGGKNLLGTQQFTNLTASIAEITNQNVDDVRESWIAGSASMHREREVES